MAFITLEHMDYRKRNGLTDYKCRGVYCQEDEGAITKIAGANGWQTHG
ncbi:MAG: hypothetical protein ACI9FJ_000257 [Alteromonadaceae bacterium]|jgi:hypothetical protein